MTQEKGLALPRSFDEVKGLATAFVASGMFQDTKQLSQAIVKIQAGAELGLPPVYSMQNINLIRNRLTSSANTMAMLVKRGGKYNYRIATHTDTECKIEFFESDGTKMVSVGWSTFTMADAKRADLVKPDSGWAKYPRAMLFSRAISQGARIYAPDAIGGIYTDEEIRSIPPRPDEAEPTVTITEDKQPVIAPETAEQKERIDSIYGKEPGEKVTGEPGKPVAKASPAITTPMLAKINTDAQKMHYAGPELSALVKHAYGVDDLHLLTVAQGNSLIEMISRGEKAPEG